MTELIRPNTCATCAHKFREGNGDLYCRAKPPHIHPVVIGAKEGSRLIGQFSLFPKVEPDWWCGEYSSLSTRPHLQDDATIGRA